MPGSRAVAIRVRHARDRIGGRRNRHEFGEDIDPNGEDGLLHRNLDLLNVVTARQCYESHYRGTWVRVESF
jgi:hypothetical protein